VTLELIRAPAGWRARLDACRAKGQRVGLVLTMGALHAGHLSLIRRAAADCGVVAVTDYVNPLQFGPTEDLSAYPRRLDEDCRLAAGAGANLVFAPTTDDLWSEPPRTTVRVEGLTDRLEGLSRPGHFDGVATIVVKLFALAGPCWAYFGEKDFQQLAVIRRLVEDLSVPVEIFGCPIVRDPDGLALSSRNAYLTPEERQVAPRLYSALLAGKRAIEDDDFADSAAVSGVMAAALARTPQFGLEYAEVADPFLLTRPPQIRGEVRLLIAARLGRARLIDNVAATPPIADDVDCPDEPNWSDEPDSPGQPGAGDAPGGPDQNP
jgi:pantoate--beta-alanine ligase